MYQQTYKAYRLQLYMYVRKAQQGEDVNSVRYIKVLTLYKITEVSLQNIIIPINCMTLSTKVLNAALFWVRKRAWDANVYYDGSVITLSVWQNSMSCFGL